LLTLFLLPKHKSHKTNLALKTYIKNNHIASVKQINIIYQKLLKLKRSIRYPNK